jgi:hypothetical protein
MSDFKIKIGEVEKPMGLTTVQMLGTTEEGKVLVICKDLDGERGTTKLLMPGFEGTDDCK